jgi:glycosyltransferase involved in cell wall biosynthesis
MSFGARNLFSQAIKYFCKVLEYAPADARAAFELGVIHLMFCRFNKAEKYFSDIHASNYRKNDVTTYLKKIKSVARAEDVTLSVCLIVKNEEKLLPRCLQSVAAIADEIVVVDTGSADRTVEIAREFGARVFHYEWQQDFAAAKNYSNQQATGDWILQLDADEEIFIEDQNKVREVIHQGNCHGAFLAIHNRVSDSFGESIPSVHYLTRLYRNRQDIYYEKPVHEELHITGEILPVDIRILHHGYNLDPDYLREKRQRNGEILYERLQNKPEDLTTLFYLSMMHIGNKENEQAAEFAKRALAVMEGEGPEKEHLKLMLLNNLVIVGIEKGDYEDVEQHCRESIATNDEFLEAFYYLGQIDFIRERFATAKEHLQVFIKRYYHRAQDPVFNLFSSNAGNLLFQAFHYLGKIYRREKKFAMAKEMYLKAVEQNKEFWVGYIDLGYLAMDRKDWYEAAQYLDKGIQMARTNPQVNPGQKAAWFDLSNAIKNYVAVLKKQSFDNKNSGIGHGTNI